MRFTTKSYYPPPNILLCMFSNPKEFYRMKIDW